MRLPLTTYGRRELVLATALAAGVAASAVALPGPAGWVFRVAAAAALPGYLWLLWFFRDPERAVPQGQGLFVSSADGVVTDVTPVGPESALGRPGVQVGVFMDVFSVHVNRSPCDGRIVSVEHRPGAYLDVRRGDASARNESTTVRMAHQHDGRELPVVFRQVAGLVARRIVTDLVEGQAVRRGQRIGMIKFGSRLELLVPDDLAGRVCVSVGQQVRAGATVLVAAGKEDRA